MRVSLCHRKQSNNKKWLTQVVRKWQANKVGHHKLSLPRVETRNLQEFYSDFEPIYNEETNTFVDVLAEHQLEVFEDQFNYLYRAYPKSQKIFLSTTFIFEDIYHALTDAMGMEIIIIGQTENHSKNHLQDLKKYILQSKYKDYLITKPIPEIGLERSEVTKATVAYLHNPDRPFYPTKIYALAPSAGALISYKKVKHIHASDITRADQLPENQRKVLASCMSRLANTKGSMVFEAPHHGLDTPLNDQEEKYKKFVEQGGNLKDKTRKEQQALPFYCKAYDYTYGLKSGAFDEEFIAGERQRHGILFDMYYGAKATMSDQTWFDPSLFKTSKEATDFFG